MRKLTALGAVLVVVGVLVLLFGHFSYTDTRQAARIGPVQVNVQEQHQVSIPTIAGIVVIVAGLGVILLGQRRA